MAFVCAFVAGGLLLIVQTARLSLRFRGARVLKTDTARTSLDYFMKRHNLLGCRIVAFPFDPVAGFDYP